MCFQEGLKGPKSTRYICKDLFIRALQKPDRYNTYHCQAITHPLVVLVYQVYNDLHHHVLLLRAAFGYHEREGDQSVVGYALRAVRVVEDTVTSHEPQEKSSGNAFVAVSERMVLRDQVEQHGGLFLD